jgi:hypothetical protein
MRILNTKEKEHKIQLPTTKNYIVTDTYKTQTDDTVSKRLLKITAIVQDIIKDKNKLKLFLKDIETELKRKPSISIKSIIKKANKEN